MLFFSSTTLTTSCYHEMILTTEAITNIYYFTKCFHITASFSVKSRSYSSTFHALNHLVPTFDYISHLFIHSCSSYASVSLLLVYTFHASKPCLPHIPTYTLAFAPLFVYNVPSVRTFFSCSHVHILPSFTVFNEIFPASSMPESIAPTPLMLCVCANCCMILQKIMLA